MPDRLTGFCRGMPIRLDRFRDLLMLRRGMSRPCLSLNQQLSRLWMLEILRRPDLRKPLIR